MYSKGITWIDDCRIPFVDEKELWTAKRSETNNPFHLTINKEGVDYGNTQGRFPANILVCDDMLNDGSITSQNTGVRKNPGIKTKEWEAGYKKIEIKTQGDKGTNSRYYDIDKWFDKILND